MLNGDVFLGRKEIKESVSAETAMIINFARGYYELQMYRDAYRTIQQIESAEKYLASILRAKISIIFHFGWWRKAYGLASFGMDMYPSHDHFPVQKAFALNRMKQNKKAVRVLARTPDWIRKTGLVHYNLACYENLLGDKEYARQLIFGSFKLNRRLKKPARQDPDLLDIWK